MRVELISKTVGLGKYNELNSEEIIAAIARHGTIKEDSGKLVKYLMKHLHLSPLQHVSFGFRIKTRRSISAQIFRHRSLNGQERSLRYDEPVDFETIELRKEHPTNRQSSTDAFDPRIDNHKASNLIQLHNYKTRLLYNQLINEGVAKECARDLLPLSSTTIIHITASFRDLLGFLNVRCGIESQKEIRDIALEIGRTLEEELPDVMGMIDWEQGHFL